MAETEYRKRLFQAFSDAGLKLRVPAQQVHGQPAWYEAQHPEALKSAGFPVSDEELAFPVPRDCLWWHEPERDARDGRIFRFFANRSWIETQAKEGQTELVLTLHYWLNEHARSCFKISAEPCLVGHLHLLERRTDGFGRDVLILERSTSHICNVRLQLSCDIYGVPSELFPGSSDRRLLSVAVSLPEWRATTQHQTAPPTALA